MSASLVRCQTLSALSVSLPILGLPGLAWAALSCGVPTLVGTELVQQPFYDVTVDAVTGAYTAGTGASHGVTLSSGNSQNVLYNGQSDSPGTSSFGVFFYGPDLSYDSNPGTTGALPLGVGSGTCAFDPPDTLEEPDSQGLESEWLLAEGVVLRHEVVAFGDADSNAGVRLTMSLTNPTGGGPVTVGARWQLDYQLAGDDSPLFANIECTPGFTVGPDLGLLEQLIDPANIGDFYRIVNDEGSPQFAVFTSSGSVAGFAGTETPDRLLYGEWDDLLTAPWTHAPSGGSVSDSAVLLYYGADALSATTLAAGDSLVRSVVIFSAADEDSCGDFVPGDDDDSAGDDDDSAGDDDDSAGDDDDSAGDDDDDDDDDSTPPGDDDDSTPPGDDDDSATVTAFFQGSGCSTNCSAGGGARPGLALLALLGFGLLRRSRHTRRSGRSGASALVLVCALALPVAAQAQTTGPSLDVQRFDPVAQDRGFTLVRDGEVSPRGRFSTAFSLNYALRPLEVGDPSNFSRVSSVVEHLIGFDLTAAYGATDWLQLGVQVPFLQIEANPAAAQALASQFGHAGVPAGVGDTTLSMAFGPVRQSAGMPLSLSVAPRVTLPTGTRRLFLGSGAVGLGMDVAFGAAWKFFHIAGNIGFTVNTASAALANLQADDELRWGLGLGLPLANNQVEIQFEWVGGTVIDPGALAALGIGPFNPVHTPSELNLAVNLNPMNGPMWLKIGAGRGISPGFGSPDLRAFLQVGLDLDCPCKEQEPQIVEKIVEKIVQVEDPDPDRDGILDPTDQCRHNPEDKDAFEDEDGCPEWDNDIDTVHDAMDRCPTEKEVLNGVDDTDGCADSSLAQIDVEKNEIVILDAVYFDLDKDKIKKQSFGVLDAVFAVMSDYPGITKVEVQGHTDDRAKDDYNLDLSQRRANAVMKYLVGKGIEASRLTAVGYGETKPIVPSAQAEADHAQNRRVQFVILEAGAGSPTVKQVRENAPSAPAPE